MEATATETTYQYHPGEMMRFDCSPLLFIFVVMSGSFGNVFSWMKANRLQLLGFEPLYRIELSVVPDFTWWLVFVACRLNWRSLKWDISMCVWYLHVIMFFQAGSLASWLECVKGPFTVLCLISMVFTKKWDWSVWIWISHLSSDSFYFSNYSLITK